nr:neprilysin-3-like [Rhipicephalus microplus]
MAKPTAKPTPSALTEKPSPLEPCTTTDCRSLADYLRRQVDANHDPCVDFYEYACGNYRGGSVLLELALAESDEVWFTERAFLKASVKASYYRALIAHYSGRGPSGRVKALVSQLSALEDEDEFERIIDKYSLGRYTSDDGVYVNPDAHALLKLLVTQGREAEFHRLVSWSIVRQLAGFGRSSETFGVLSGNAVWYKCLMKVSQVMEAPLMGVHLLKGTFTSRARGLPSGSGPHLLAAQDVLRASAEEQLVARRAVKFALDKLHAMRLANGFPHGLRNAREMDARYAEFPESPSGASFWRAWLSAARIVSRLAVTSNSSSDIVFTAGSGAAFYGVLLTEVFVPANVIGGPVFYKHGPAAHNYGVIGMVSKTDNLNHHSSENLADFVGALVPHVAFSSLPERLRRVTVPGDSTLNLTSEQLYFVSRCIIGCTRTGWQDYDEGSHAAERARRNVPAMNMHSFGEAFNCPPGSRMNPVDKCAF